MEEKKKVVPIASVVGADLGETIKMASAIFKTVEENIMPMGDFVGYVSEMTQKGVSQQTKTASATEKEKDEVYTKIAAAYDIASAEYVHNAMTKVAELMDVSGCANLEELQGKVLKLASDIEADKKEFEKIAGEIMGDLKSFGKDIGQLIAETSMETGIPMNFSKTAAEKTDFDKVAELLEVSGRGDIGELHQAIKKHLSSVVEKQAAFAEQGFTKEEIEQKTKYLV